MGRFLAATTAIRATFIVVLTGNLVAACTPASAPLAGQNEPARKVLFLCDRGSSITVTFQNGAAQLDAGAVSAHLAAQPVGSGIHYAGDGHDLRGKGRDVTWTDPAGTAHNCRAEDMPKP